MLVLKELSYWQSELENYLKEKIDVNKKSKKAQSLVESISVVKEGIICGGIGVNYMHGW